MLQFFRALRRLSAAASERRRFVSVNVAWLRLVHVTAVVAPLAACGGESRRYVESAPSSETSDPPPSAPPLACPAELLVEFGPSMTVGTLPDGVTVDTLAVPDYSIAPNPPAAGVPYPEPDPSAWDRSETPAGACVFRLHGVDARCYPKGATFFTGSCGGLADGRPLIAPYSFYDAYKCTDVSPGCAASDPWSGEPGNWWYFAPESAAVTRLVVCAPACANSFFGYGGCLRLHPNELACP
jgi:hypothetical protein